MIRDATAAALASRLPVVLIENRAGATTSKITSSLPFMATRAGTASSESGSLIRNTQEVGTAFDEL